ncbi:MAG: efflux RND transporter permease subunit, partial [Hyphomicrobiaceae bacterium]
HEWATLAATAATFAITIALYIAIPKSFLPLQDTGLITASYEAHPSTSFEAMTRLQAGLETIISKDRDVAGVISVLGLSDQNLTPNAGYLKIILRPRDQRSDRAPRIIARLATAVRQLGGLTVTFRPVQEVQIATRNSRGLYQFTLTGTNGKDVSHWADRLVQELKTDPRLRDVGTDEQRGGLRAFVNVNRALAARVGVSMANVNDALNDAFGQRQISTIYAQSNQYRVVIEADPAYARDPSALDHIYVPSSGGNQIPLNTIAQVERTTAPLSVLRQDQFPAVTVSYNLAPHTSLSQAIETTRRAIAMPASITGSYAGEAAEFARALNGQPWLILAAVVCIYLVLGILYESAIHPFTILTTLPSAGIGAVLALWVTGLDLSVVALIGIVLLMGIVKKNAILMIDFAIEAERHGGMSPLEAILEACRLRFRPIMMTTLAALLGALPLAIESGTGSELRNPLGITIIGGLLLSQLLTLYTTPVIYLNMERLRAWITGGVVDVRIPRHPHDDTGGTGPSGTGVPMADATAAASGGHRE